MIRCAIVARALLTMLLIGSWNIATTHCAFAAATTQVAATASETADECPMHGSKKPTPEPHKNKGCADLPCCKSLPAAKLVASVFAGKPSGPVGVVDYSATTARRFEFHVFLPPGPALDTGPPALDSFTEIVLRRSLPAHAPPGSGV